MLKTLFHDSAENISIKEKNNQRYLYLQDDLIQSQIDITDASILPHPANRAMLASLLFNPHPEQILLGGCGAGAIARWSHHHLPSCAGKAIEISPQVIELAYQHFDFPGKNSNWAIEQTDIKQYLATNAIQHDLLLIDIAENNLTPDWVTEQGFLNNCKKALKRNGVLTINLLVENQEQFALHLWHIRQCFDLHTLCLSVPEHQNILVFAFRQTPDLSKIENHATTYSGRFKLELTDFLTRMKQENPVGSGVF